MNDTPIVNGYPDEDALTSMPSDVEVFILEHGIADKYTCLLRVYSSESNSYELVKKYMGVYPDPDDVGKQFGPGKYSLMFSWMGVDGPTGRRKPFAKEHKFTLSESYRSQYEEFLQEQNEARQRKEKQRLEARKNEAQIRALENGAGPGVPATTDPMEAAERLMEKQLATAAKLAQLGGGRGDNSMAMIIPLIMDQNKNTMTMMMGMFTAVVNGMNNRGGGQGEGMMDMMKGFTALLGDVVTMKRDLDGEGEEEKESVGERIFNTFVNFVPVILEKFSQSAEARRKDPLLNLAKGSPEYRAMAKDPAVLAAAVNRLDRKYSPLQTDKILEVMGLARPEVTKANYQRFQEPENVEDGETEDGEEDDTP